MLTTTTIFEGNLAADPELRFTPSGKQVVEFTVLVNGRRQNDAGEWEDREPNRHQVKAFGTLAENTAGSLQKGDRVIVAGNVTTDSWDDKETGAKRTMQKVLADAVGISLRWATAEAVRNIRTDEKI
ncbi:single-stranded DNA-binding protein [Mumia sp. zg.B21]|uniref:single-stranded DNA-binding protein n=1 Tax=Mumia sp. zg.B21 TaxID=2855447 RepID=UPI001C6F1154|nr:single-stranded DNA-binding protein [Mumia sp. zg.B21]MBW9211773.1 single-stranded DNA-binding protein [Mumia sp. zg.B21]